MSDEARVRDKLFIGGEWVRPDSAETTDVINAANGTVLGRVVTGGVREVESAVASARKAFASWSSTTVEERARLLGALAEALALRQEEIARVISLEVGTPLKMSRMIQVGLPQKTLKGFAEAVRSMDWESQVANSTIRREPVGVVAAITPWNYPLHQLVGKLGGALAAGCTVVAKPAEVAPLSAFMLAEIAEEVGLPAGVFNLVTGPGRVIGEALASHPDVDMVSFTGSTAVGSRIAELAARNITRVSLELGGKSASILLDDADQPRAVKTSVNNCFLNSGQTCSAWTRLIVPKSMLREVESAVVEAAEKLSLGHPLDEATRLGPLASLRQQKSVLDCVEAGKKEARLVFEGHIGPELEGGFYVAPTIFSDVDNAGELAQEEIFGPVLSIIAHKGDDDAIRLANESKYGLAGAVWSADVDRARSVARQVRTGQIDINGGRFNPGAPFGGFKKSGYGREFGHFGVEDFTELKAIQE